MPKISSLSLQEIDYYIYKYQLQLAQMPGNQELERILTSLYIRKKQLMEENSKNQSQHFSWSTSDLKSTKRTISNNTAPTRSSNQANQGTAPDQSLPLNLRPTPSKTQEVTPVTESVKAKTTNPSFKEFEYKNLHNDNEQSSEADDHPVTIDINHYLADEPAVNSDEMTTGKRESSLRPLEPPAEKIPENNPAEEVPTSSEDTEKPPQPEQEDEEDEEAEEEVVVSTPKHEKKFATSPYKMAPLIERAKATTIDYSLIVVGFWISNIVPKEVGLFLQPILNTDLFVKNHLPLNIIWFFGIIAIYHLVLMKEGQSYGKKMIGLKIINDNDELILTKETIVRRELLGKSASILMGFYGFYLAFQDKENQLTFHDKFSHTRVITVPKK